MPRGRNTRDEIVAVAMRMFIDRGYDKTSLREIAEEIGVTKAALYYHFRTKEEIAQAALDAHISRLDALLEWVRQTPPSRARDEELVDRLQGLFQGDSGNAMRFGQVNPTVLNREQFGKTHVAQIRRLVGLLAEARGDAESTVRAVLAFGAVVMGALDDGFEAMLLPGSRDEQRAATRRVALELLAGNRTPDR